jgi:uncharacterized protein with GYD domain
MPRYLLQLAYSPEAWAAQIKDPQNRVEQTAALMQRLGGRFETVYYAFGEYDIVGIAEFPDNVRATAFSMVISAGGSGKATKITPLISVDEGLQAMRLGGEVTALYAPPRV